jgi:hypothetical protein
VEQDPNTFVILLSTASRCKFFVKGDMLRYTIGNGLYLSGSNLIFNKEYLNFYSDQKNLSAYYPPFSGTPVENYNTIDNNALEFNLPNDIVEGEYKIIFCNPAGYDIASKNKTPIIIKIV